MSTTVRSGEMELDLDLHEMMALGALAVAAAVGFVFWLFNRAK